VPSLTIENQIFRVFSVPADGTGLPNFKGSGDFGTSPFYGQLPGQASSSLSMRTNMARRTPKHKTRPEKSKKYCPDFRIANE
jgi:hypothetical protein